MSTCWFELRIILLGNYQWDHHILLYFPHTLLLVPLLFPNKDPLIFSTPLFWEKATTQVTQMTIQNGHIRGQQECISTSTSHFHYTHASTPSLQVSQWENKRKAVKQPKEEKEINSSVVPPGLTLGRKHLVRSLTSTLVRKKKIKPFLYSWRRSNPDSMPLHFFKPFTSQFFQHHPPQPSPGPTSCYIK